MPKGFSPREERVVKLLADMNIPRNMARAMVFFSRHDSGLCSDIQKVTRLRQPEVSTAMQTLKEMGWVETEPVHREVKGRPIVVYRLKVPFERMIDHVIREEQGRIKELRDRIQSLRELLK